MQPPVWCKRFLAQPVAATAAVLLLFLVCLALCTPILPLAPPNQTLLESRLSPPFSEGHLLGTDLLGRDILSRLLWGTRTSLAVAVSATFIAAGIGSLIGLFAGFFGKKADWMLMRSIDTLMAFPYLLLALAIVAVLGPGLMNALIAIAVVNIPFFARTVRGATLGLVKRDFVDTARLNGRSEFGILFGEVLPNVFPVILITMSTTLGWMILETAGLSFLGLGAQPPQADLGSMLGEGRLLLLIKPHLALLPGVLIFLLVLTINLAGDGLRDALDPRMGGSSTSANAPAPGTATPVVLADEKSTANSKCEAAENIPTLEVENLCVDFSLAGGTFRAVDRVSFRIPHGGTLGLAGESGSGKSVTALSLLRLLPGPPAQISRGRVRFHGSDLLKLSKKDLRAVRGNRISYVFQDPLTSLNPLLSVGEQIAETIRLHQPLDRSEAWKMAGDWMERLEIPQAKARLKSYPHELSGGMRQRIGLAMAMVNEPELIIADEPTTALDVTVQKTVTNLLLQLVKEQNTALLFISHDLALISEICEEVVILYAGRVMESGSTADVLGSPGHPYTKRLLDCLPLMNGANHDLVPIPGQPPTLTQIPCGCAFAPRCEWADEQCTCNPVSLRDLPSPSKSPHQARCIRPEVIFPNP